MAKMKPWSFSSLSTFEQCPRQFHAKYVTKTYNEPPQAHLIHGTTTHKHLEDRMRDKTPLPPDYAEHEMWCALFEKFPAKAMLTEEKMALTRDLKPTEFFAKDTWWRGVIDLALIGDGIALVVDWKTGKIKPDFTQLNLFAAAVFARYPDIHTVKQTFAWLAHKKPSSETITRDGAKVFWQQMLPRVNRLESAFETDNWFAKPSGLCRNYCHISECEFKGKGSR